MWALAAAQRPFFFLIDFELQKPLICTLEDAQSLGFEFEVKGFRNFDPQDRKPSLTPLSIAPVPKAVYTQAYQKVVDEIYQGNTFLLNLTFPSAIQTPLHLEDVFHWAKAPYKLLYQNHFVVYSPECFVKIKDGHIYSYPMKGTIDAQLPEAKKKLETDPKEINEHNTIVDLIRNDLSKVAKQVQVTRFRYLDKIKTQKTRSTTPAPRSKANSPPIGKASCPISSWACFRPVPFAGRPKPKPFPSFEKWNKAHGAIIPESLGILTEKTSTVPSTSATWKKRTANCSTAVAVALPFLAIWNPNTTNS